VYTPLIFALGAASIYFLAKEIGLPRSGSIFSSILLITSYNIYDYWAVGSYPNISSLMIPPPPSPLHQKPKVEGPEICGSGGINVWNCSPHIPVERHIPHNLLCYTLGSHGNTHARATLHPKKDRSASRVYVDTSEVCPSHSRLGISCNRMVAHTILHERNGESLDSLGYGAQAHHTNYYPAFPN